MKILQINSVCDFGSTGRTTRELADYLEQKGHECYVAYGHGRTTYHRAFKIGGKWENHFQMPSNNQTSNKRIAKNTLMLYVRMLFSMAVSLYTSRVVLQTLGVSDYGVYSVVGGVVGMLGFLCEVLNLKDWLNHI